MIELVNLEQQDISFLLEILNEPGIRPELIRDNFPLRESDIRNLLFGPDPNAIKSFGLRKEDALVGVISLYDIDWINRKAIVGNLAVRTARVGLEAVQTLVTYGFSQLGLHRIECHAYGGNTYTPWICEKIGGVFEGAARESLYRNGSWTDVKIYSMLDREWKW